MPYRRLPKTDAARLKAMKTLLDNNDIYTVRNRFLDWKLLGRVKPLYERLSAATEQYRINMSAQTRNAGKITKVQRKAAMYVSHFLQVLFLAVERGEVKQKYLELYGLEPEATILPNLKTVEGLLKWGRMVIDGEKARIKAGGRPIYNPTIGMVSANFEIFVDAYQAQQRLQERTTRALEAIAKLRPECDDVLLELWNAIESHFADQPAERRFDACRKFGVIYYYRRHEPHEY